MGTGEADPGARVVEIFTDGACRGNPGPGGWGALLRYGEHERELCGGEAGETTNNRMELTAPIAALETLTRPVTVRLHTDSTYVKNGITKWVPRWKARGWLTAEKEPVKNVDLWQRLEAAVSRHEVEWIWVKGHAGHVENERADRLAARGLAEALGEPVPPAPAAGARRAPRTGPPAERAPAGTRCAASTKLGAACPITPRPSGYCHVHDPAVQCGRPKKDGRPCTVATGGGPCQAHRR